MKKYSNEDLTRWKCEINAGPIISARMSLRRENTEYVGLCPFHQEKTPSFKVYRLDDGPWGYKCFGCGANGNVFQFIQKIDNIPFAAAVEKVLELAGVAGWESGKVQADQGGDSEPGVKRELRTFPFSQYAPTEKALAESMDGQSWIENRGLTLETARRMHLGFVQDATAVAGTNHPWAKLGWILFPTLSDDGQTVLAIKYRSLFSKKKTIDDREVSGILRAKDTATMLYNLQEINSMEDAFIVEGEPDTAIISQTGIPCTGYPSGQYHPTDEDCAKLKTAARRFLAGDSDETGDNAMDDLWPRLGENTFRIKWPKGRKDANDTFLNQCGGNQEKFTELIEHLKMEAVKRGGFKPKPEPKPEEKPAEKKPTSQPPAAEVRATTGDKIKPKKVKWLWQDRVPMGKITLYAGNPDNGKSLAAMDLAARVTKGKDFPDSPNMLPPSEVLMLLGEDDLEDTAVPRLMSAGADLTKVHFPEGVVRPNASDPEVRLDLDLPAFETYLDKNPGIKLIIIDPISNYLGDVSMVAEQEARSILIPLKRLAGRRGIAVVVVMHLNKKNELDAISRVGGAMAFIGVARSSWMFIRDASGEEGEVKDSFSMARIKSNLTKASSGGTAYHIEAHQIDIPEEPEPVWAPFVVWDGAINKSADDVLEEKREKSNRGRPEGTDGTLQAAMHWLEGALQSAPQSSTQLKKNASEESNISWATLRRAQQALGIKPKQVGRDWIWELPEANGTREAVEEAAPEDDDERGDTPGPTIQRDFDLK